MNTLFLQQHGNTVAERVNEVSISRNQRSQERLIKLSTTVVSDFPARYSRVNTLQHVAA